MRPPASTNCRSPHIAGIWRLAARSTRAFRYSVVRRPPAPKSASARCRVMATKAPSNPPGPRTSIIRSRRCSAQMPCAPLIVVVSPVGFAGSDEQFELVAGAVDRNPEHAEPVAHPRDRDHLRLAAVEDEDLAARRDV